MRASSRCRTFIAILVAIRHTFAFAPQSPRFLSPHSTMPTGVQQKQVACLDRQGRATCARRAFPESVEEQQNHHKPSVFGILWRFAAIASFYIAHLTIISQHVAIIGRRWVVGYDILLGLLACGIGFRARPVQRPWQLDKVRETHSFHLSILVASALLILGYTYSGTLALFWDDIVYKLSAEGWPITKGVARALPIVLGHGSWAITGLTILSLVLRPTFWKRTSSTRWWTWMNKQKKNRWVAWVVGGYAATSALFAMMDGWTRWIIPAPVWEAAPESIVSQLVAPEYNDRVAMVLGCIAPCITAPLYEEILYRGFALAALSTFMGGRPGIANVLQSLVFSAHHRSVTGFFPLWAIGLLWGEIYRRSGSLAAVTLIHTMWNARVFIGSWCGLPF